MMLCMLLYTALSPAGERVHSEAHDFRVRVLAEGLRYPWGLAFLPDGDLLVSERGGTLRRVLPDGAVSEPLSGVPAVAAVGQGGLLDIALHPDFGTNRLLYLAHAASGDGGHGTELVRARLDGMRLVDAETIFRALPKFPGGRHFGARVLFLPDGTLLLTLGDRGHRPNGQHLGSHPGAIVRLNADGSVPADNPFAGLDGVRPEIHSFGHRNVQGIALDRASGTVWAHEHGPQGGDEVNRIVAGRNYGWADITYGRNYGTASPIGEGEARAGVAPPALQWTPSIAPSGLAVYDAERFPRWRGNLFAGALSFRLLVRLVLDGERVVHEERLLEGELGRMRTVAVGPDGLLYLLTDAADGVIARLEPVD